jgi:hypothetical protein
VYVKEKNEDFMTLLSGVMGQANSHSDRWSRYRNW